MSKFTTKIPVEIKTVLEKLPKHAHVHEVKLAHDRSSVEVIWDHDAFATGFTFPVEFPVENLFAGKVPDGVKVKARVEVDNGTPGTRPSDAVPPSKPQRKVKINDKGLDKTQHVGVNGNHVPPTPV